MNTHDLIINILIFSAVLLLMSPFFWVLAEAVKALIEDHLRR